MKQISKIFLLGALFLVVPLVIQADDLSATCQQFSENSNSCQNLSSAECQAQLQKCADFYDAESAAIAKDITTTSKQKNTLQNAITVLKKKITGLESKIKQGTLMVKDLNS